MFASRAVGALQGPKEGSRSGTPKGRFKATAGGGLRREECGGVGGRLKERLGLGVKRWSQVGRGRERETPSFLDYRASGPQGSERMGERQQCAYCHSGDE